MYYPQEVIEQVIEANNIVDVIGSYVSLKKKGSTWFGLCPFHNEKTPSFSVTDNGNKQMFYCFGCHTGGSVLTFLMKYENYTYTEAVRVLADRAGIKLPEPDYSKANSEKARLKEQILEVNKEAAKYFFHLLKSQRGAAAYKYLKDRGLKDETILSFGLGYSDVYRDDLYRYIKNLGYSDDVLQQTALFSIKENDVHDLFWNRVMFPIMDTRNRVIGFGGRVMGEGEPKYLNSRETICFEKSRNLYGLNVARRHKGKELILCEGYMDVITLHQAGFTNAVASLGTALTDGHAGILKRYTDHVVISYDADTAGQDAALRAIQKLKTVGISVKVANLEPYKDPDELIKAKGSSEYEKRLQTAVNGMMFEIAVLSRSFDLRDPDENTRFGNAAADKLSYIQDDLERENYVKAVCAEYGFDRAIINGKVKSLALSHEGMESRAVPPLRIKKEEKNSTRWLEQNQSIVLSYLAGDRSFYDRVSGIIDEKDFTTPPYDTIAEILFSQLRAGKINPAGIISSLDETEDQEKAADILNFDLNSVTDEEKKKMLNDSVMHLKQNSIDLLLESETQPQRMIELRRLRQEAECIRIF